MAKKVLDVIGELLPLVSSGSLRKAQGTSDEGDIVIYKVNESTRIDIKPRKEVKGGTGNPKRD